MQAFGITINKITLPLIYLACSIVGYLLMLESIDMFQHPIATRAISVILQLGFILLALPAINSFDRINISPKAIILTFIWLSLTLISTLLGEHPWAQMVRWFEILSTLIASFCLYLLISQKPEFIKLIAKAIMAALIVCLIAYSTFWFLLPNPITHNWANDIPLFVNIRHFGYIPAAALPLGYWLLETNSQKSKSKYSSLIYLSICWALVFWLGGRGTFLGVTTATILYCIISKQQIKWVATSIILGLLLSQLFIVDHPSLNLFRILDLFLKTDRELDAISSFRMTIYIESLKFWWSNAPFLGIGADGYRHIIPAIGNIESIAHPHSIIIQLLISYGIAGLLIPSYFFIILSWKSYKTDNKLNQIFYLSFLSSMILSIFDGILYNAYGLFITAVIAGICISLAWPQEQVRPTSKRTDLPFSPDKRPSILLALFSALTILYYIIFIHQLYTSKYSCADEDWVNWNAKYPIYFSPTWTYARYSNNNIDELKTIYIKNNINKCSNRKEK